MNLRYILYSSNNVLSFDFKPVYVIFSKWYIILSYCKSTYNITTYDVTKNLRGYDVRCIAAARATALSRVKRITTGSTVEDDHSGVRGLLFCTLRPSTMSNLQIVFNTKRVAQSITWTVRTVSHITYLLRRLPVYVE